MPLYEYECSGCGIKFENLMRSSSESRPKCPECNSRKTRKLLSTFSAANPQNRLPCAKGACNTGVCPSDVCHSGRCPPR